MSRPFILDYFWIEAVWNKWLLRWLLLRTDERAEPVSIFTARQRNCRKVMFSQVCVCHSTREYPCVTVTHDALKLTVCRPLAPLRHQTWKPPLVTSGGDLFKLFHLGPTPKVTSHGGHWNRSMYDTHPTGLLSSKIKSSPNRKRRGLHFGK